MAYVDPNNNPIILIDEFSSFIDNDFMDILIEKLVRLNCQIFLTGTHIPEIKENDVYYHIFNCIYHLYKKILILQFEITDPNIISTLYLNWSNLDHREEIRIENNLDNQLFINLILQNPKLEKILEINIGTYITHNTIVSAMNNSSLFIRKCYDTSFIEEYSHILKDCDIIDNQGDKIKIPEK